MALRYSGQVRVRVTWRDDSDDYRAVVSWPDGRCSHTIGLPPSNILAVDSPAAYDAAARAALSFTLDEVGEIPAATTPSGDWYVARKPEAAWMVTERWAVARRLAELTGV
jgi:hypothetical protein